MPESIFVVFAVAFTGLSVGLILRKIFPGE